jgi:hypothetical protein
MAIEKIKKGDLFKYPTKDGYYLKKSENEGILIIPNSQQKNGIFISNEELEKLGYKEFIDLKENWFYDDQKENT